MFHHLHTLEGRVLLSGIAPADLDPDDQIAETVSLGAMTQTRSNQNQIDSATDVDLFSFSIAANQKITFDVDSTSTLNSLLRLFDSSGVQLASNDDAPAPGEAASPDSFLSYTFTTPGAYTIGVSSNLNSAYSPLTGDGDSTGGATGAYTLILSPGLTGSVSGN